MNYQNMLGPCQQATVSELIKRHPVTLQVFCKYLPDIDSFKQLSLSAAATDVGMEPGHFCQELFDTLIDVVDCWYQY